MDLSYVLTQNLPYALPSPLAGVLSDPVRVAVAAATNFIATFPSSCILSATLLRSRSPESLWLPHAVPLGLRLHPLAHSDQYCDPLCQSHIADTPLGRHNSVKELYPL